MNEGVMIAGMAASVVLVVASVLILYETLRLTSDHLADLPVPPRARIIAVVLAAFVGHTIAVWTYALAYWLLAVQWQVSGFAGIPVQGFEDCLYFSVVAYTSLGFGDHVPVSHMRIIAGVEALNGLLLIGWSVSFTYLCMERYWPLHGGSAKRPVMDTSAALPVGPAKRPILGTGTAPPVAAAHGEAPDRLSGSLRLP